MRDTQVDARACATVSKGSCVLRIPAPFGRHLELAAFPNSRKGTETSIRGGRAMTLRNLA
jgi:hypothetical protein